MQQGLPCQSHQYRTAQELSQRCSIPGIHPHPSSVCVILGKEQVPVLLIAAAFVSESLWHTHFLPVSCLTILTLGPSQRHFNHMLVQEEKAGD